MNFAAHARFEFHKDGRSNRRDADADPRVLLLASANDPQTDEFIGVIAHFAGDEYSREIPTHAINAELAAGMDPEQAFELGRLIEGDDGLDLEGSL